MSSNKRSLIKINKPNLIEEFFIFFHLMQFKFKLIFFLYGKKFCLVKNLKFCLLLEMSENSFIFPSFCFQNSGGCVVYIYFLLFNCHIYLLILFFLLLLLFSIWQVLANTKPKQIIIVVVVNEWQWESMRCVIITEVKRTFPFFFFLNK